MRYLNSQKYDECQLVVLINALIYYKKPAVDQDSAEYERLVDLICARKDAPLYIEKAFDYLRLKYSTSILTPGNIKKHLDKGTPVSTTVKDPTYEYHCILIVDHKIVDGEPYFKIPNWGLVTKRSWASWKAILPYIPRGHSYEFGSIDDARPRKLLYAITPLDKE